MNSILYLDLLIQRAQEPSLIVPLRPLVELGSLKRTLCPISYETPSGSILIRPFTFGFAFFLALILRLVARAFFFLIPF